MRKTYDVPQDKWYFFSGILVITPKFGGNIVLPKDKISPIQSQVISGVTPADRDGLFNPQHVVESIVIREKLDVTLSLTVQNFFVISKKQAEKIKSLSSKAEKQLFTESDAQAEKKPPRKETLFGLLRRGNKNDDNE